MKLQEAPELIPTGEMPRHVPLTVDRELTDKCTPGNRVKIVGMLCIMNNSKASADSGSNKQAKNHVRMSYIKVLGIQSQVNEDGSASSMGFAMPTITDDDKETFETLKKE